MICFCHMIKTAGTTLNYILRNNYGHNVFAADNELALKKIKRLLNFNKNIRVISGHSIRATNDYDSFISDIKYITFLRNPVERYISHYNHRNLDRKPKQEIKDRLKLIGENDYQTKFILGATNIEERSYIAGKNELEKAKRKLNNDYSFVGLVEKFDESLVLMKRLINCEHLDIRYKKKNVNKSKAIEAININESIKNEILEANKIDCELFSYVNNILFQNQIKRYGNSFEEDVNRFKKSNINYKFNRLNLFNYRFANRFIYKFFN